MKRFFSLLALLLCSVMLIAQTESQRVQVGLRIGAGGTAFLVPKTSVSAIHPNGNASMYAMKIGAVAGLAVDIRLKDNCFLQTGLYYSLQRVGETNYAGFNRNDTSCSIAADTKYTLHRMKLPVMFHYHLGTDVRHWTFGIGLFTDVAMGGKLHYSSSAVLTPGGNFLLNADMNPFMFGNKYYNIHEDGDEFSQKHLIGSGPLFNRLDMGLSAEVGYSFPKVYIGVHCDLGLMNMANAKFFGENFVQRNLNAQVLIGYKIN